MPSPFGKHRGDDSYYQFAGDPQRYVYNWTGMPFPSSRFGPASLGAVETYPVSQSLEHPGIESILHSGPEQSYIHDGPRTGFGAVQMSRNEKAWLGILAAGVVGYVAWKKWLK